jgi:LysM repeat protein
MSLSKRAMGLAQALLFVSSVGNLMELGSESSARSYEGRRNEMKIQAPWRAMVAGMLLASMVILAIPDAVAAAECTPFYHPVQAGERLSDIAARYGVNMWDIVWLNGLASPDTIYAGQWLRIPGCYPPSPPPVCYRIHVVRRGETLTIIAARYGVSVWRLASINGIRNINRIYVGQRLKIPGSCPPSPPPYPPPPYPPPPPPPPPPACAITPILGFGRVWSTYPAVRVALGCPKAPEYTVDVTQQRFQSGVVLWRGDANRFWVLWSNRTWAEYDAANWYDIAWRLGMPLDVGAFVRIAVQDFDGGRMIWSPTLGIYVLYSNNTWQHFN